NAVREYDELEIKTLYTMKQSLLFLICLIAISTSSFGNPAIAPPRDAPLPIGIAITLVDDVSCHGESDGSATILVTDLALLTSYSYEIKNSADEVIQSGDQALLANLISNLLDLNLGLTIRAENLPADTYTFSWTT